MKKPIVLSLVFLALLAFVYFYEIEGEEDRARAQQLEESLLRLGEKEIISLLISRPGQPDIELVREGLGWVLRNPLQVDADQNAVEALLRSLKSASRVRSLAGGAAEAGEYGLEEPRLRLHLQATGQQQTLLFGADDFTGNNLYLQFEGETDVFLTEKTLWPDAGKDLFQWRSRKVLDFDRNRVTAIELENPGGRIRLVKEEEAWLLEAPLQEEADSNAVLGLLSDLDSGEVQEFVSEEADRLDAFGLERPTRSVRLGHGADGSWKSLQLGDHRGEAYLARDPDKAAVFTVEKKIFDRLSESVWVFRDKDVVNVVQDEIVEVRIARGDEQEEIRLAYADYAWTVLSPEAHRDQEVPSYTFWYPINDIRFQSIDDQQPDQTLFSQPDVEIVVTLRDGTFRSFDFVAREGRYLARRTETGRQGSISEEDFKKLQFEIEDVL